MKIDAEKLKQIIENHGKWLRDEEGGQRAGLSNADLRGAYLRGADLRGADLSGADLRGAGLSNADLRGAGLSNADLRGADLDKKYYQIVRLGSRRGTTTYCADDDNVLCGCWNNYKGGTLAAFKRRVDDVYGEQGSTPNAQYYAEYMTAIKFFEAAKELQNENGIAGRKGWGQNEKV